MTWLCDRGHHASAGRIRAAGVTRSSIARALVEGRIISLRRGVYACSHLDEDERRAGRIGGLIDCVSARARHPDVWCGPDEPTLHVRVPAHSHPLPDPGARMHWRELAAPPVSEFLVSATDALRQAMACLDPYNALAAVESSAHLGYLDRADIEPLLAAAPRHLRPTLDRADFRAQSGLETIARLRLQDAGHRVECQVVVPGAGPLDLLVDGRVGIETDGRKWHEQRFIADRSRDIHVALWGIPVLRLGKPHVIEAWPTTLRAVEGLLRGEAWRA